MNKNTWRVSMLFCLSALSFAGCASLTRTKPASAPAAAKVFVAEKNKTVTMAGTQPLFVIERNKNANIVRYDANRDANGKLNPRNPVIAYWVLLAEDGRIKKLNWVEKKKAYGIKIRPAPSLDGYTMTLAAAPWMPLAVKETGTAAHVEGAINGRPAILKKMFIQARDRLMGPKVEYIELYGQDLRTGEECSEKIIPK